METSSLNTPSASFSTEPGVSQMMPSLRLWDFPFSDTSHRRTKKSVCSEDERRYKVAVSGPIASAIGGAIGLGEVAETIWSIARWPVVLIFVTLAVATLYYAAPNVKQPKFRWISVGAGVAILVWILASVLFGFYVGNFGSYNKTYGALAGVVVFLLWLWITNLALLFGAELDAELERGRQLQAGIVAERDLQLPPRDSRVTDKNQAKEERDVEQGRALRQSGGQHS